MTMKVYGEKKRKRKSTAKANTLAEPCCMENWECEQDCRALARAEAIKADPERYAKAKEYAKKLLEENKSRKAEAQAMIEMAAE